MYIHIVYIYDFSTRFFCDYSLSIHLHSLEFLCLCRCYSHAWIRRTEFMGCRYSPETFTIRYCSTLTSTRTDFLDSFASRLFRNLNLRDAGLYRFIHCNRMQAFNMCTNYEYCSFVLYFSRCLVVVVLSNIIIIAYSIHVNAPISLYRVVWTQLGVESGSVRCLGGNVHDCIRWICIQY